MLNYVESNLKERIESFSYKIRSEIDDHDKSLKDVLEDSLTSKIHNS